MYRNEVIKVIEILRKYNAETDKIEAKTAAFGFPKKCYDTFSSFSNKNGGIIIFGLSEDKNFEIEGFMMSTIFKNKLLIYVVIQCTNN